MGGPGKRHGPGCGGIVSITVITPTGDRPVAFELCRRWMGNQTVMPDQWVIVDDGHEPMNLSFAETYVQYLRRERKPGDPQHTMVVNVSCALSHVSGDRVFFIEDDDYYAPDYIETVNACLDGHLIAGVGCSKYYHLPTGGWNQYRNTINASLAQTAFRADLIPFIRDCIIETADTQYLDIKIWRNGQRRKEEFKPLIFSDDDHSIYVGMKGLPGRAGIGAGHNPNIYRARDNESRDQLKRWVPRDYQAYLDLGEYWR
jgi:hypothetical protein